MAANSTTFFFPFAPIPSTSADSLSGAAPTSVGVTPSGAPPSQQPYTGTFAGKKLSCITCRKGKAKCIWIDGVDSCELCLKRGVECPGPAAPQRKSKQQSAEPNSTSASGSSSPAPSDPAVDWAAIEAFLNQTPPAGSTSPGSIHSLNSANTFNSTQSQSYSLTLRNSNFPASQHRSTFSPYSTAVGRPRLLGPSSSEASLNGVARAKMLKRELVDLYDRLHQMQMQGLTGWKTDAFHEFVTGPRDHASRVFASIRIAIGARSTSSAEVTQVPAPSLTLVDVHDKSSTLIPGGFGEWGVRRHGACVLLGTQAIESATQLAKNEPTMRSLKILLAGLQLCSTLHEDREAYSSFTMLAINTFRTLLASDSSSEEEKSWLLASVGPRLLMRDCKLSLKCAVNLEFGDEEAANILRSFSSNLVHTDCFGIPIWDADSTELVIFDEGAIFAADYNTEISLHYTLAHLFAAHTRAPNSKALIDAVRAVQQLIDSFVRQVKERIAPMDALDAGRVFVLHQWTGKWRPSDSKAHAQIIVHEIVHDLSEMHLFIHDRLQTEVLAGRLSTADLDTSVFLVEARERSRAAIRTLAQCMIHFTNGERTHATNSNLFLHIVPIRDWVELTLARHGDHDGPLAKEHEVTTDEIGWLVKGLRVGSFSQSALVTPLRELEAGWELLRREEVARELERQPFDLTALLADDDD